MALLYKKSEDKDGHIVVVCDENGLPVVIDDEKPEGEQEFGLDAIHLIEKVPTLQEEAKNHRLKAKEYSEKLKAYDGIDPQKAAEAIALAKNLSAGDLQKKEEVERIKKETEEAWKLQIDAKDKSYQQLLQEKDEALNAKDAALKNVLISSQFAKSQYFTGKEPQTKLTPDIAEAYFSKNFRIETVEGVQKPVGYLGENAIYSKSKPGELADFEEAMGRIIDAYPMKDAILHKSQGSGSPGGGGTHRGVFIKSGDTEAFGNNLEAIAKGDIQVLD